MAPAIAALSTGHFCALYSRPQPIVAKNSTWGFFFGLIFSFERHAKAIEMTAAPLLRVTMGMKAQKSKWRLLWELDHSVSGSATHKTLVNFVKRLKG